MTLILTFANESNSDFISFILFHILILISMALFSTFPKHILNLYEPRDKFVKRDTKNKQTYFDQEASSLR